MEVSGRKFLPPATPFQSHQFSFIKWLQCLGYAMETIKGYKRKLTTFFCWLEKHHIKDLSDITPNHLASYNQFLHQKKNLRKVGGLGSSYIQSHINIVCLLSKYLELTGEQKIFTGNIRVESNIASQRKILTQEEINQLYESTDDSLNGLRDRAILGLYYGCGLRCCEGIRLKTNHIDYKKQLLYVAPSKNYRDRFIPMNDRITKDLQDYETYSRPNFIYNHNTILFLLRPGGHSLNNSFLNNRLKHLLEKAKIKQEISLHSLRHSIATHFLHQGMPLEQISKFLGHITLESTQIYTRIAEELNT
ncbi:tyrosine-type recombinase/integrase [Cardinium endosymbiont of Culicoides punctatus]|uniref:tyrosine-type recombinase/integrase n=1 Tax=Cardinium endosymbiont of Culicoides punctatus TaxID=2304601 RepID=UPI001058578C|nr:tyrosine-type recombinase/integrase [Cardinium endosymbiont of Culicoides punctatus]TDG95405.1 Tyrosine recombinase XerD [Cardinium endosymbiont of Culicoides punctatus]